MIHDVHKKIVRHRRVAGLLCVLATSPNCSSGRPVMLASIIGSEDNRKTFSESGITEDQIRSNFSGTGEFYCGPYIGTASLILRNSLLTLAAHTFFRLDASFELCVGLFDHETLSQCYFRPFDTKGNPTNQRYYIQASSLRLEWGDGTEPKKIGGHCKDREVIGNDWAVVELKDPVPGEVARAYEIFDTSVFLSSTSSQPNIGALPFNVTVISAGATNFSKGAVPTICRGIVGFIGTQLDADSRSHLVQTNSCSMGAGGSGSAVVMERQNEVPVLIGLATSGKSSAYDGIPYGNLNFTSGPLAEGEFKKALVECRVKCPDSH